MNHTITIEKIIFGGQGLGRLKSGIVVLCPFVLPGETVIVSEVKRQRGYIEAELIEILDASIHRIEPPCPYYSLCGGCDFQHIDYQTQLIIKQEIIQEAMDRSKISMARPSLQPTTPSPDTYGYRSRIRLKLSHEGRPGYYRMKSNRHVPIDRCMLATENINAAISELIESDYLQSAAPFYREIELMENPADNTVHAVFHPDKKKFADPDQLTALARSTQSIDSFSVHTGKSCVPVPPEPTLPLFRQKFKTGSDWGYSLTWGPDCFSQVNAAQNQMLVNLAVGILHIEKNDRLLDLYCGIGNFSIPFALAGCSTITGIEMNKNSLAWAKTNSEIHGILNSLFIQGDVGQQLNRLVRDGERYDATVLDPPRQGVGRKIHLVADLKPRRILYISCDPATLMRDLAVLTAHEYTITELNPVDMFPQTHHIESMALLEKN